MASTKDDMNLYHRRLFSTVALFGSATLFLAVPELHILDATGHGCSLKDEADFGADGRRAESRIKCDHGKVSSLDFFEFSACLDENHGTGNPDAFGHESTNGADAVGPVLRVPQVESFVLYDHCAAPAWPFGTKIYDASDFKLHKENTGYIGKDRFVGGARLAMMKRAWVMLLAIILFGLCILMRFLTFTGIISSKMGDLKMFRSFQNVIEVASVLFCGLYIISALSTLYRMRDCTMPEYLFDSTESGFSLEHVFPSETTTTENSPGAEARLAKEIKYSGTQNKLCGADDTAAAIEANEENEDEYCCHNSVAHFVNARPGRFLQDMTTVNGETYLQSIIIAVFLFFLPLVSFVGKYFVGYPLLDVIGSGLLFAASIQLLVFSIRGVETGRCGDAGEQLASLGSSGGQGGFTSGQGVIFMTSAVLLLVYSALHFMRSSLKFNPDTVEPEALKAVLRAIEDSFGNMLGHSYAFILSLLLAISVGTVIGTNATDMCDAYDVSGPSARLIEGTLLCMYIFSILFAISGSVFHELIFDLPCVGSVYSQLRSFFSQELDQPDKNETKSQMGYASSAPMNSNTIQLTTFN